MNATTQSTEIGARVTCAETGKSFTIESDGCTFNFARTRDGAIVSDEGVNIRERRELLNRSIPFFAYVSRDGRHVTGWKGNILGDIVASSDVRHNMAGRMLAVSVVDVHGAKWHGRGLGRGMCVTLRASKT